ncbi:MAG: IMP cyclohydrolase [Nanoarchaeota archaeon]
MSGLEALAGMDYPGRFIALGLTQNGMPVAVYGITGRSPPSQARRLVERQNIHPLLPEINVIMVEPTDEKLLAQGDRSLLIYPAMMFGDTVLEEGMLIERSISVSNGAQTNEVHFTSGARDPIAALLQAHRQWKYESDPNYTPRISGKIVRLSGADCQAALGIIKRTPEGTVDRHYFEVPLTPGRGRFISTYSGENQNPLPSFRGEPLSVEIRGVSPEVIARELYDALEGIDDNDFRVSVVAAILLPDGSYQSAIVNRHGNGGSA